MLKSVPFFATCAALLSVVFLGCSDSTAPTTTNNRAEIFSPANLFDPATTEFGVYYPVSEKAGAPVYGEYDIGDIHNRVMYSLETDYPYPYIDPGKNVTSAIEADSKTLLMGEFPTFSEQEYDDMFSQIAPYKVDGQFDLTTILTGPEYDWWTGLMDYCSGALSSSEVHQRFIDYGAVNGLPLPGTDLAFGVDVLLTSSEFWFDVGNKSVGEKKNLFSFIMADAGGAVVGARVGRWVGSLTFRPDAVVYGAAIGGVFGSAGYLIG